MSTSTTGPSRSAEPSAATGSPVRGCGRNRDRVPILSVRPSAEAWRARLRASEDRGESDLAAVSDGGDGLAVRGGWRQPLGGTPAGSSPLSNVVCPSSHDGALAPTHFVTRPEPWEGAKDADDTATAAGGGGNKPAT